MKNKPLIYKIYGYIEMLKYAMKWIGNANSDSGNGCAVIPLINTMYYVTAILFKILIINSIIVLMSYKVTILD